MLPYNGVGLAAESNAEPRAKLELIRSMPLDFAQSFECAEKTTERNIQLDGKTVTQAFFTGIYQDGGQCGDNTATRIIVVKLNNIPDQCDYIVMHYGKSNTVIVERDMSQILSTLHFLD